jgi:hypothetical protein
MRLSRDFRELLECFVRHDVRYLIVGGWALAAHGVVRYTKDLDVWIWPEPGNARSVMEALDEFGFGGLGVTAADFVEPDLVVQLGYPPNRVDLLTTPSGVDFATCWQSRLEIELDGLLVPFLGLDELKLNKRAAGRPQDLADLHALGDEEER